jgi:hypothetical protein
MHRRDLSKWRRERSFLLKSLLGLMKTNLGVSNIDIRYYFSIIMYKIEISIQYDRFNWSAQNISVMLRSLHNLVGQPTSFHSSVNIHHINECYHIHLTEQNKSNLSLPWTGMELIITKDEYNEKKVELFVMFYLIFLMHQNNIS